jgi:peptidoglycan/LPS O-acetylase OafA/YrhL
MTNEPVNTVLPDSVDQVFTGLNHLHNLSAEVLIFIVCVAFGFGLRKWTKLKLRMSAAAVVTVGAVLNAVMAEGKAISSMPPRIWLMRSLLIGVIVGCVAFIADAVILSRLKGWIAGGLSMSKNGNGNGDETPPATPPPTTPPSK